MKASFWVAGLVFLLSGLCLGGDQHPVQAGLRGYVFEEDGTSPVEGAVVFVQRLPDKEVEASSPTDREGMFEISFLKKGIYVLSVRTAGGNYNGGKVLGIGAQAEGYAKMYIALYPFSGTCGSGDFPAVLPDPVGQAVVLAGNAAVVAGVVEMDDEPREAGPFRIEQRE